MISHFQTEDYLKNSGLTYTILRNTMYADALTQILGPQGATQDMHLPGGTGLVPYALRREMGEGTANLLLQEGHENKTYQIMGSKAYGYADIAKVLSDLSAIDLKYHDIPGETFEGILRSVGFPDFLIYLHAGTIMDIKNTQYELEDHTLSLLLGRPTASLNEILKELYTN